MNPAMMRDQAERQMAQSFIPALIMAGSTVAGAIAGKGRQDRFAENQEKDFYNRRTWEQQNFDPYAPFRAGAKGAIWAAQMKTWGFDKMFPKEMMDYVSNPANVPGTAGVIPGGREYVQPNQTGMPQPKHGMGAWDFISAGFEGARAFGGALGPGGGGNEEGYRQPPTGDDYWGG